MEIDEVGGTTILGEHVHCPPKKPVHCMEIDEVGGTSKM